MSEAPETHKVRAIDVLPYRWAVWCTVGDDPVPFANAIESRSWSDDGQHIWFLLSTHNFHKAAPDEELDLVPRAALEWAPADDTPAFLAKRPVPTKSCQPCNGTGRVPSEPARLDADKTAQPKTRIIHHPLPGKLAGPGMPLVEPELEDVATGARTPMVAEPQRSTDACASCGLINPGPYHMSSDCVPRLVAELAAAREEAASGWETAAQVCDAVSLRVPDNKCSNDPRATYRAGAAKCAWELRQKALARGSRSKERG